VRIESWEYGIDQSAGIIELFGVWPSASCRIMFAAIKSGLAWLVAKIPTKQCIYACAQTAAIEWWGNIFVMVRVVMWLINWGQCCTENSCTQPIALPELVSTECEVY